MSVADRVVFRIIVPTVGITLLATPAAPDLLHVPAPKNVYEEKNSKLRFLLSDVLVRFVLFVPVALVIYAWTFYFVWRSQVPGDLLPFAGIFGIGLRPSFYASQAYSDSRLVAQNVMLFALVLFQASSSASSLHSTYDIITTWKRVPNFPWVCSLVLSVIMQVRQIAGEDLLPHMQYAGCFLCDLGSPPLRAGGRNSVGRLRVCGAMAAGDSTRTRARQDALPQIHGEGREVVARGVQHAPWNVESQGCCVTSV